MSLPSREQLLSKVRSRLEEKRRKAQIALEEKIEEIVNRHAEELEKVKERFLTNLARKS